MRRLRERLDELYAIGGGAEANRVGYSPEEDAAHELAAGWVREAGFEVEVDEARQPARPAARRRARATRSLKWPRISTPFPRAAGTTARSASVAGIEALERLGRRRRTLAVVAFREEERGCVGSRAPLCLRPAVGRSSSSTTSRVRASAGGGPRSASSPGIVGYKRGVRELEGRAGHAGTTPMEGRSDALVAAAEEILRIRDVATSIEGAVATVGTLEVEPGGDQRRSRTRAPRRRRARAGRGSAHAGLLDELGLDEAGPHRAGGDERHRARRPARRDRGARPARRRAGERSRP